jgi:hypothetical protein
MTHSLTISRIVQRRRDQRENVKLFTKALASVPRWKVSKCVGDEPEYDQKTDNFTYSYKIYFVKDSGKQTQEVLDKEWAKIVSGIRNVAEATRWHLTPWKLKDITPEPKSLEQELSGAAADIDSTRSQFGLPDKLLSLAEVRDRVIPQIDKMLDDENELRSVFSGIFSREPQIRTVLSSVKSFLSTNGQRRNHVLLYGLPACAKTQILLRLKQFLGEGAVVTLDATSTTQAGIYKLFLDDLDDDIPPFVVIEEIEKTAEDALRVWLGALDDRGELRKMNFNMNRVREIRVLCMATANDKILFDKLMGGSGSRPGALSSRFVNQLYCERPDEKVLEMILRRDITKYGGKEEWIEPALKLAREINTNDPRKVLAFLDGGDRLLEGSYQEDIVKVMEKETEEMHADPTHINTKQLNQMIAEQLTHVQSN